MSDFEKRQRIAKLKVQLKGRFIENDPYLAVKNKFDEYLDYRRAEIEAGQVSDAPGLWLSGAAGSGKSRLLRRLFDTHPNLHISDQGRNDACLTEVPSKATHKRVGEKIVRAVGYPSASPKRNASQLWELAQFQMQKRHTLCLALDEVQHLHTHKNEHEAVDIIDTFKSIMNCSTWPVIMILAGIPKFGALSKQDRQLFRRLDKIQIEPIKPLADCLTIQAIVGDFARFAQLEVDQSLQRSDFVERLSHASFDQFGSMTDYLKSAIVEAAKEGSSSLSVDHFATAFRDKFDCVNALNVFSTSEFQNVDPTELMGGDTNESL